jgi:hypothetical protein
MIPREANGEEALPGYVIPGANLLVPKVCTDVPYGYTPFDIDNQNCAGRHEHVGVWYYGTDKVALSNGDTSLYKALISARSTRLPAGEYTYLASTYGYIMRRSFPMFIPTFGRADIEADLIQGAQIRVGIEFFDEGFKTPFNGWVAAEVFDAKGNMVGASIYGQAQPNCFTRASDPNDECPGTYHPYEPQFDWQIVAGPSQGAGLNDEPYMYANWPGDTLPYGFAPPGSTTFPSNSYGQRADESMEIYGIPQETWAGWDEMSPSEANRLNVPAASGAMVDVYGFYGYTGGAMRTWAGGWPTNNATGQTDYGLKGSVDIPGWPGSGGGLYTIKVWAFDPFGPDNKFEGSGEFSDDWRMFSMATRKVILRDGRNDSRRIRP